MNIIRRHFRRYLRRPLWPFSWRIGVESTLASLVAGIALSAFGAPDRDLSGIPPEAFALLAIIVAPVTETLVLQAFPIFISRKLGGSFVTQTAVGTIVFALAHLGEGIATTISAGVVGGFYFSFAYALWRRRGRWPAFLATAGAHAVHNAIAVALMALGT
jgi:hypothetical protein